MGVLAAGDGLPLPGTPIPFSAQHAPKRFSPISQTWSVPSAASAGPLREPLPCNLLGGRWQNLPRRYLERFGQLPHGPQRDRATGFDPLVVPEAEAKAHHVLLSEVAGFP